MAFHKGIRIWAKENFSDTDFLELDYVDIQNLRSEEKGLGGGTFSVLLNRYDEAQKEMWNGAFPEQIRELDLTNYWVFIQATNLVDADTIRGEDYQPQNNHDASFIWWGFCGEYTREIQRKSMDSKGTLTVYEFGHWVNKHTLRYFDGTQDSGNENGFNPILTAGLAVGNKDMRNKNNFYDTYYFEKYGKYTSTDPESAIGKPFFFTVKEAINHMIMRSIPSDLSTLNSFLIKGDWTNIGALQGTQNDLDACWLNDIETIDSFAGSNLTDALSAVLDSYTWFYQINTDDDILVSFRDKVEQRNVIELNLSKATESFAVMSEQQKYDGIKLIGDRILFYGSMTTYTPFKTQKSVGIFPRWTDAELDLYVSPKRNSAKPDDKTLNKNITELKKSLYVAKGSEPPKDETGKDIPEDISLQLNRELSEYKTLRNTMPKPYQDFYFGYCDPTNITSASDLNGKCLATFKVPGAYGDFTSVNEAVPHIISFFPFVSTQKSLSEAFDSEGIETGTPIDLVLPSNEILNKIKQGDARSAALKLSDHQTPVCTEMKFHETAISLANHPEAIFEPTFYYRTYGKLTTYTNGIYAKPMWINGTKPGADSYMSSQISFDYDGVTLKSPEPELFSCPDLAIWQSLSADGKTFTTAVRDWGVKRDEWKTQYAGASRYDYYRNPRSWATIAHWGRLVFSVGAYSAQRLILQYGKQDASNVLKIDDDSYKLIIARKGYVYGVDNEGLKYNADDMVIKNDLNKMARRMSILWAYYSRNKKAVKMANALFNSKGDVNNPVGITQSCQTIGKFITNVIMQDGRKYEVNSYISSYEFDFNSSSPRILIQTEYPDSPTKTRNKKLSSIYKERKYTGDE